MKRREQILTLINSDIVNYKLVRSLCDAGLDASNYCIDLTDVILDLIGTAEVKRTEELYYDYFLLVREATKSELSKSKKEAKKIYQYLLNFNAK